MHTGVSSSTLTFEASVLGVDLIKGPLTELRFESTSCRMISVQTRTLVNIFESTQPSQKTFSPCLVAFNTFEAMQIKLTPNIIFKMFIFLYSFLIPFSVLFPSPCSDVWCGGRIDRIHRYKTGTV